jgi:hypothetical protein
VSHNLSELEQTVVDVVADRAGMHTPARRSTSEVPGIEDLA